MSDVKPRVKVPKTAEAGEVITVKTLINHPMESGQRRDRTTGDVIPRQIINRFTVSFEGETVFSADLEPAVSANPFFEFEMVVPGTGTLSFAWVDDDGSVYTEEKTITVS